MSICAPKEILKGFEVSNPNAIATVNLGTLADFNKMTVFNETDKRMKVNYKDEDNNLCDFIIPAGKSFTRIMNKRLLPGSVQLQSLAGASTGVVIFNLGN